MTAGGPGALDREESSDRPRSLLLFGAGKMGGAMLEGWLAGGLDAATITVVDPNPSEALVELASSRGLALNPGGPAPPEILVLAIKPQMLDVAAPELGRFVGPNTLVISILAGKTVADIAGACGRDGAVVRAMPNLPASIGRGATGAYASPAVNARQRGLSDRLLAGIGLVEWVDDEDLIDAVTALSGSGPAYVFHLVECMAAAGAEAGLEPGLAQRLAQATVVGAAALLDASAAEPGRLREDVTSPAGTTAAALAVLMAEGGLGTLMTRAVAAAKRRAGELSG